MMNKRRILVFGDSNSWGWMPRPDMEPTTRYDVATRWPGVLSAKLGDRFEIVEEALSGRTTDLDDPEIDLPADALRGATLNGARVLPALLASHLPLDLVIIMLGTNDLKKRFRRQPADVASALVGLARLVRECEGGVRTVYPSPQVLLIAPPPLGTTFYNPDEWAGAHEKSLAIGAALERAATGLNKLPAFDAGKVIAIDGIDGVHLTADAHRKLGEAVAEKVRTLLGPA
ncbi:MAG: SGNH/GDSL hydrolase family protein [Verrucomicrobia bacterium]|nr:SGNH/GDSL hydrolase family protein [Verrucomicrobiota bacterium]